MKAKRKGAPLTSWASVLRRIEEMESQTPTHPHRVNVGCAETLLPLLTRRTEATEAPRDDSGVMIGTLVPALAGPQDDEPANAERPRRRRAKAAEEPPPPRDKLAWCRDYDQQSAEASGRFFEPGVV